MAIPPVKPGGYGPNDTPRAAELAELDAKLAARGLDTQAADTTTGYLSFFGVTTTTANKTISITGAGATAMATIVFGDNDDPQYLTNRSRTVFIHPTEAAFNFAAGDQWKIDDSNAGGSGATYGIQNRSGSGAITLNVPLDAKPHDGATITGVTFFFQVPVTAKTLPSTFPTLVLSRRAIATGVSTTVASAVFGTPANIAAYINGGAPNSLTISPGSNNLMDLATYNFALQFTDDSAAAVADRIVITGIRVTYGSISDNRPSQ